MAGTKFRGSAVFTVLLYASPRMKTCLTEWQASWERGRRGCWPSGPLTLSYAASSTWPQSHHVENSPGQGETARPITTNTLILSSIIFLPIFLYCRTTCLCHFDIITRKNSNIIICSFTRNHNQQQDYKTQLCLAFVINTFSRPNEYEHFKTSVPCVYQWQKTGRKTWRERGGREGEERNGERRK